MNSEAESKLDKPRGNGFCLVGTPILCACVCAGAMRCWTTACWLHRRLAKLQGIEGSHICICHLARLSYPLLGTLQEISGMQFSQKLRLNIVCLATMRLLQLLESQQAYKRRHVALR